VCQNGYFDTPPLDLSESVKPLLPLCSAKNIEKSLRRNFGSILPFSEKHTTFLGKAYYLLEKR